LIANPPNSQSGEYFLEYVSIHPTSTFYLQQTPSMSLPVGTRVNCPAYYQSALPFNALNIAMTGDGRTCAAVTSSDVSSPWAPVGDTSAVDTLNASPVVEILVFVDYALEIALTVDLDTISLVLAELDNNRVSSASASGLAV
jgi:hypothetical protein